jgi:hypothetical protein
MFTAAPPLALGLLDWSCTAIVSYNFPKFYKPSQAAQYFNGKVFWHWMSNGILVHKFFPAQMRCDVNFYFPL